MGRKSIQSHHAQRLLRFVVRRRAVRAEGGVFLLRLQGSFGGNQLEADLEVGRLKTIKKADLKTCQLKHGSGAGYSVGRM